MKHHFRQNLSDRKGVVSNLHCFMDRGLDTGFKTKWSGFWVPPYKFLDYYAIKINGVWLSPETVEATEYGDKIVFQHSTDSLDIREIVEASSTSPGVKVSLEIENRMDKVKAVKSSVELGVDIRHKDQDISEGEYTTEKGPGRLSIHRNERKLLFSSEKDFELKKESYVKEHFPGERQECFVPGEISFKTELEDFESLEFKLTTPEGSFGVIEDREQVLDHEELGYYFGSSADSLRNLIYDRDEIGVIAGHPWFQSYWARDSFWTVLGLIDIGYFELAEDILTAFARRDLPDKIVFGDEDRRSPKQYDTDPLFIIAADKLERHYRTNQKIEEAVEKAVEDLEVNEEGVVENKACGTWMDTEERPEAVDIQSLWIQALKLRDNDKAEELERGLKKFKAGDYMRDSLQREWRTVNPAVPLMFGQLDNDTAEKYLEVINGEFSSRYGARTVSFTDEGYSSSGYHCGSVWGLTTGWVAAANLSYGKENQGLNFLEKFFSCMEMDQPGALPELVDAETGESLGCSEQAWSAGIAVHVIDTYLLGLTVSEGKLFIDPPETISCRRLNKRVKDEEVDLKFEDGEVEVLNKPSIEVVIEK